MSAAVVCFHYFYPPLGGVAARRAAGLTRRLGACGWRPVVVTPSAAHYYSDPGWALHEVADGSGVVVVRTGGVELSRAVRGLAQHLPGVHVPGAEHEALQVPAQGEWLRRAVREWLYVPDAQIGWVPFAYRAGLRAVRRHGARALYSSSFPVSAHAAALLVAWRTGLPWLAEFRDLWVRYHFWPRRRGLRRRLDAALEGAIVRRASRVLTVTETWCRELAEQYPQEPESKFRVLPNGYEPSEFEGAVPVGDPETFRLVYVGTMYGERQDPEPLYRAMLELVDSGVVGRQRLRLEIVGHPDARAQARAEALQVADMVEFTGFVAHPEAVARQRAAHVLVLLLDPQDSRLRGCIPGKLFEYLAVRRPILAVVPAAGEAAALVRSSGAGVVVSADAAAIAAALRERIAAWREGRPEPGPDDAVLARYGYDQLARVLAGLLDEVTTPRRVAEAKG